MGWYLRKSVSIGPLRLNFSKSGIGYSVGMRGLRVGKNAHGKAYVHAGSGGLYYRQTLQDQSPPQAQVPTVHSEPVPVWIWLPIVLAIGAFVILITKPWAQ